MNTVLGQISAFSGLPDDEQARASAGPSFWECREAAEPGCQGPDGYSVDRHGRPDEGPHVLGIPTEHTRWFTQVGSSRPGQ